MEFKRYFLDFKSILTEEEKKYLKDISKQYQAQYLFENRNINDISIDFAYTNAKVEGCTYTYQEAETLILSGRTANNKSFFDAPMIINLKDTYIFIMSNKGLEINIQNIKNIHKLAMKNLLSDNELGNVRKIPVRIGGSDYIPSTDKNLLENSLNKIVLNSNKYIDNFEKAIYLHNNLA